MNHPCVTAPVSPFRSQAGLTLIEVLTAILVLGVIVGLGGPSFVQFVQNTRIDARSTAVLQLINQARAEATAQRRTVVVCGSLNGLACSNDAAAWSTRVISFIDCNSDGAVSAPVAAPACSDRILSDIENGSRGVTTAIAGFSAQSQFAFNSQGFLTPSPAAGVLAGGTVRFCDSRGATSARALLVRNNGRVASATDTNNPLDGVVNDVDGNNVTCP